MGRFPHPEATDRAPWLTSHGRPRIAAMTRRSEHVPMRDGTALAVTVHLPDAQRDRPLPTILRQTRYYRGVTMRRVFDRPRFEYLFDHASATRQYFVAQGYAWVDVCARGSGASYGSRPCPWSPDETADGADVVDWIVAQPWSNGVVGATGVSYDGTTAEMLLVNGHRAVKAIVPRFSLFDVYTDVAFPGGIHLTWFTALWATFNRMLDSGALDQAFARMIRLQVEALRDQPRGPMGRLLASPLAIADTDWAQRLSARLLPLVVRGVAPVDGDDQGEQLAAAIVAHGDNFDVHQGALQVDCRDDAGVSALYPDANIDFFSPHAHVDAIRNSGAAIYSYTGWLDGGYQHGAIKRFGTIATEGRQLIIGPWDHGGPHNISPHSPVADTGFDHEAEMLRFFDRHLRGRDEAGAAEPPVRYFTIGQERWKTASAWPPPGCRTRRWHLAAGHGLQTARPATDGADDYAVDATVGTGRRSRWASLLGLLPPVGYGDRREPDRRLLVYRSSPLAETLVVTGHPVVSLFISASTSDAHLFAYLEDERPDGRVDYVTEGHLRAWHRKLAAGTPPYQTPAPYRTFTRADTRPLEPNEPAELRFDLLPISWQFRAGHRLRLALAGADRDHFVVWSPSPRLAVHHGPARPSCLELPVEPD